MNTKRIKELMTLTLEKTIKQGVMRASKTLRHVKSAWVENQEVVLSEKGEITEYRVHLWVTFILDD